MWWNKKKPVRVLDMERIKTIEDLKNLFILSRRYPDDDGPYRVLIRGKLSDRLYKDIEPLLEPDNASKDES